MAPSSRPAKKSSGVEKKAFAAWNEDVATEHVNWLAPDVLTVKIADSELATRLGALCLTLESRGVSEIHSNSGGYQSKDLTADPDPAVKELKSHFHTALATYLRKLHGGRSPPGFETAEGLCISAVPEKVWANVSRVGNFNNRHRHAAGGDQYGWGTTVASGVYYASASTKTTNSANLRLYPNRGKPLSIKPEPGLLVLFPTDLDHDVEAVPQGEGPRISVAFNLLVRWLDQPLSRAAVAGDVVELRRLVSSGNDLEVQESRYGFRAVHYAAEAGELSSIKVLAELGADMSAITTGGWSALGLAYQIGYQQLWQHMGGDKAKVLKLLSSGPGSPVVRKAKLLITCVSGGGIILVLGLIVTLFRGC